MFVKFSLGTTQENNAAVRRLTKLQTYGKKLREKLKCIQYKFLFVFQCGITISRHCKA